MLECGKGCRNVLEGDSADGCVTVALPPNCPLRMATCVLGHHSDRVYRGKGPGGGAWSRSPPRGRAGCGSWPQAVSSGEEVAHPSREGRQTRDGQLALGRRHQVSSWQSPRGSELLAERLTAGAPGGTNVVPGGPPSALGSLAAALSRRVLWPHGRAGRGAGLRLALTTSRGLCGARESRSQSWRHRSSHRRRQPCGPLPRNRCSRRRHRLRTHVSRADGRKRVSHSLARSCVPPAAHPCRPQAGVPTCAAWGSGSAAPGCPG